jgi:hypothetical protein
MSCNLLLIEDNEKSLVTDGLIHFYFKNCIIHIILLTHADIFSDHISVLFHRKRNFCCGFSFISNKKQ